MHFSVERPFDEFNGINCHPEFGAKLRDRIFHQRRQVPPPVIDLTHRLFDGLQHVLYRNLTVGSRHGAVTSVFRQINHLREVPTGTLNC